MKRLVILVAVVIFAGLTIYSLRNFLIDDILSPYPSCPEDLPGILTAPILDMNEFTEITPLGNLNPPQHSTTTDHLYLLSINEVDRWVNVYSPGNIILSKIHTSVSTDEAGNVINSDYGIQFVPCKGVTIELGHVGNISDSLKEAMRGKGQCQTGKKFGVNNEQCLYTLNTMTKSGELVGNVKAKVGMATIDFLAWNKNTEPLAFANPERYGDTTKYAICPLDLYSGELREELYNRLGRPEKRRVTEPRCGEVMQDIVGTLQGAWFGQSEDPVNEYRIVSLVHENYDPSLAVAVVAGAISEPGKMTFISRHSGTFNREFSEVKADGVIYCYQDEVEQATPLQGKLLVRLENEREIQIEHKEGQCGENEKFEMSYRYFR